MKYTYIFPNNIITDVFSKSLKGMWGPPSEDPEQGLVQDLSRISYIGFLYFKGQIDLPKEWLYKSHAENTRLINPLPLSQTQLHAYLTP